MLQCRIFPAGSLNNYMFTAVCSNFNGKWLLSMHEECDTWETQGGHIEDGETPLECARRELFEESGITDADIYPICDYWGFDSHGSANGMVFLAVVHSTGELPESEMRELSAFRVGPIGFAALTYQMFSDNAEYVKQNSPFDITFILSSNWDYIGNKSSFEYRSYETDISNIAAGTGEILAEEYAKLLNSLK